MTAIRAVLDYLQFLLRYIVAGIIAVLVCIYIDESCFKMLDQLLYSSPVTVAIITCTIGVLIYAVHQALPDKIFYWICLGCYTAWHKLPDALEDGINNWNRLSGKIPESKKPEPDTTTEKTGFWATIKKILSFIQRHNMIMFGLFGQNYLRKASDDPQVKSIQGGMENKLALLNFLYCTFYVMLFIPLFFLFKHDMICGQMQCSHDVISIRSKISMISSAVILLLALLFDYRIVKREMWTVQYFFQAAQAGKKIRFRLSDPGRAYASVFLAADFNQWNTTASPMEYSAAEGAWIYDITLYSDRTCYKFFTNTGLWLKDPDNPLKEHGTGNSVLIHTRHKPS